MSPGSIVALESVIAKFGQESALDAAMERWEVEEVRYLRDPYVWGHGFLLFGFKEPGGFVLLERRMKSRQSMVPWLTDSALDRGGWSLSEKTLVPDLRRKKIIATASFPKPLETPPPTVLEIFATALEISQRHQDYTLLRSNCLHFASLVLGVMETRFGAEIVWDAKSALTKTLMNHTGYTVHIADVVGGLEVRCEDVQARWQTARQLDPAAVRVRQLQSTVSYTKQRAGETQAELEACRTREGSQIAENRKLRTALEASRREVQASARAAEVTRSLLAEREATQLARMAAREKRRTRVLMEAHEQELMGVEERQAVTAKRLERALAAVKRLKRALMLLAAAVVVVIVGWLRLLLS
jgi:hypothetical protein